MQQYSHQQRITHSRLGRVNQNNSFSQDRNNSYKIDNKNIRSISLYQPEQIGQSQKSFLPQINSSTKGSFNPKIRIKSKIQNQIPILQQNQLDFQQDKLENQMQIKINNQLQKRTDHHTQEQNIQQNYQNMQTNSHQNNSNKKINTLYIDQQTNRSNESLLQTVSGVCIQCQLRISFNYINLKCQHKFHTYCLKELLQNQVRQQNFKNFYCQCGTAIKNQLLMNHFPNLLKISSKIQCLIIMKNYQQFLLICENCQVCFIINKQHVDTKISSYCLQCEKICQFEKIQ